ncbi:37S ribosomal protein S9, mitochondrial [Borealophlyctis nickersoniae]|nr:37S ribosomal protein S9, mitochondrial [Borealophlyctis nickersoniae]
MATAPPTNQPNRPLRHAVQGSTTVDKAGFTSITNPALFVDRTNERSKDRSFRTPRNQPLAKTEPNFQSPHPTPRPTDIAYFTGNPKYYAALMTTNDLIRKHGLDFKDTTQFAEVELPKWMSLEEMKTRLGYHMYQERYTDFITRLNILYTVMEKDFEVRSFLLGFVGPKTDVAPKVEEEPTLDEYGRSHTLGWRKSARAQCWMVRGEGHFYVNGIPMSTYFGQALHRHEIVKPFDFTGTLGKYNVWALVEHGGPTGQAGAVAVAAAKGIAVHEPEWKTALHESGLSVVDPRRVERKKTGQPKARKKNQWVKR